MSRRTPTSWKARLVGLLILSTALAVGCGSTTTTDAAQPSDESAATETAAPVIPTVSGGEIDFGSIEGTDTVLWFWAPW